MCRAVEAAYESRGEARSVLLWWLEAHFGVRPARAMCDLFPDFPPAQRRQMADELQQLAEGCPVQYILGYAETGGQRWQVSPAVLIPRPETQELVEWVLHDLPAGEPQGTALRLFDVGTGSGFIAVQIAAARPDVMVEACDISARALEVARRNAADRGVGVRFFQADLYHPDCVAGRTYDVVVSNPPYVRPSERRDMQERVWRYEPAEALFVTETDPLRPYRALAALARRTLLPGGRLYVEINQYLYAETRRLLLDAGWRGVTLRRDAFGHYRMLRAEVGAE